ncbi:unnamed protein product [Owenia fusiformis]|uniref:Uncharacterized protein n=1 Tax=Owenia fusiformis TaxID=6347 RepID=A0A8J1TVJ1_OWEFU|nr:unnamed protein product [Owenia fusiformis]
MPRRKLEKVESPDDVAPLEKKVKTETTIDGTVVQWEWESDTNEWTKYGPLHSEQINDAYNSSKAKIDIDVGPVKMTINFQKFVQKNKKTGWERRIRCCLASTADSSEFYCWSWKDEFKSQCPYMPDISMKFEKALHDDDAEVEFEAGKPKRQYILDIKKMIQRNAETNKETTVSRTKSAAKPPTGDAPTVVKSEPKAAAKATTKSAPKGKSTKSAKGEPMDVEEEKIKTIVMKGKAPVDPECTKSSTAHVYCEGSDVYDAMLNQTNLMNNNNKYYICQLLEDDTRKAYSVWFRWGRVGKVGQNSLMPCGPDLDEAKKLFTRKFHDKTKNDWSLRNKFSKVAGKYDLVKMDYSAKGDTDEVDSGNPTIKKEPGIKIPPSKLDKRIQDIVNMICDIKSMEDSVIEMKYDAKKAPLGKLGKDQIKAGYTALKKIDKFVREENYGKGLVQACDEFYTRIPHDFGMKRPPVLRTKEEVKAKLNLLEALDDIEVALKMLKKKGDINENPVDTHYKNLNCTLKPLEKSHADFKMVEDYVTNTHAPTHQQYKMLVEEVMQCDKEGETENYKDYGNKMLLWHGSRLTNYCGILSQGLRIAPPEAPVTGYMFGKGVYFADMSSKSANYCFATRAKNVGYLLLCEVSLGQANELLAADYGADKLPAGKHSVHGLGRIAPDPKKTFTTNDGVNVPLGKPKDTGVTNPTGYTLNYNEFIVYNTNQVRMKYLVKVKFNFK